MPRSLLARAAFAAVLGWGEWAGLARAGGSDLYPRTPPAATELPPGHPPVDSSPSKTPLRDWCLKKRPCGCWASFNGYGCSSLRSEMAFLFGGCRTFFAEPCLKGAPPSALPPWAGRESGYWNPPPGSPAERAQNGLPPAAPQGCTRCP
ncbi:MAG: hypothetical protein U0797_27285 [Gemmataceae bacterium]